MTTTADAAVAAWPSLSREPGFIYRCKSGGFFVEVDGVFPTWRPTEAAARELLADSGKPSDGPVVDFERTAP
jgi:hypothetical protein